MLESPIPWKEAPKSLHVLLRSLIESSTLDNLLRLLGREREILLARMIAPPFLDPTKVSTRMCSGEAGKDACGFGHIDVKRNRSHIGVTREGLADYVDAVV